MEIINILRKCVVEGNLVKLPPEQLDRELYLEVAKQLQLIGGKWKGGKVQGFVFNEDPTDYLQKLCEGEKVNLKKEYQFFGTPPDLADRLVELAEIQTGHKILEPSAGQGAIVNAIHRCLPNTPVDCYELMELNRTFLTKLENTNILGEDFLTSPKQPTYDRIIANPPFAKNQDIDHVTAMYERLSEGGRLVSIMSNHWRFTNGKKEKAFNDFIEKANANVYDIEAGAFKESGTSIAACIVVIERTEAIPIPKTSPSTKATSTNPAKSRSNKKEEPETEKATKEFSSILTDLSRSQGYSTVFDDFLDYVLLASRWWEKDRDFSHFDKRYKEQSPKFLEMFELLAIIADNKGSGYKDGLGDLFMQFVSYGNNGQFFTPTIFATLCPQLPLRVSGMGKRFTTLHAGAVECYYQQQKRIGKRIFMGAITVQLAAKWQLLTSF